MVTGLDIKIFLEANDHSANDTLHIVNYLQKEIKMFWNNSEKNCDNKILGKECFTSKNFSYWSMCKMFFFASTYP